MAVYLSAYLLKLLSLLLAYFFDGEFAAFGPKYRHGS